MNNEKIKNSYEEWVEVVTYDIINNGYCPYCEDYDCVDKINEKKYKCKKCEKEIGV